MRPSVTAHHRWPTSLHARGRRAFLHGLSITIMGIGLGALTGGSAASASTRQIRLVGPFPFPLPQVGVEIPCSLYAANVPVQINTGVVNLDFKGGIRYKVETSDSTGLKLSIVGCRVSAVRPELGTVTLEQANTSLTPLSILMMSSSFPPSPQLLTFLDFTLTVSNPPGGGGPLVVSTLSPAQLLATNVTQFPPSNLSINLQAPVPLGTPGSNPATAPVLLQGFPALLNQEP